MFSGSVFSSFISALVINVVIELLRYGVLSELLYADDLVLMIDTIEGLNNMYGYRYILCRYTRLAALNLPTLVYRRIRGDMKKTFNILSNIYDSRVTTFLSKSNFSTRRGHNF